MSDAPPSVPDGELTGVDFFWRPGCGFCMALERNLNKAGIPLNKFNIWENPDDAAFVRSVADGNEVVPTIRIADVAMVNPSGNEVISVLADKAPHLVPEGASGEDTSALGRLLGRVTGN